AAHQDAPERELELLVSPQPCGQCRLRAERLPQSADDSARVDHGPVNVKRDDERQGILPGQRRPLNPFRMPRNRTGPTAREKSLPPRRPGQFATPRPFAAAPPPRPRYPARPPSRPRPPATSPAPP